MKFPFDHGPGDNSVDEGGPDVTSNVLDRLGLTDAKPDPPRTSFVVSLKGSGRVRFVAFLGMIILGSIAWRALSTSDDSIVLVETVPRTIENGRASRAQLFMGFMSPFEEIGRAITEVEEIRSPGSKAMDRISANPMSLVRPFSSRVRQRLSIYSRLRLRSPIPELLRLGSWFGQAAFSGILSCIIFV